MSEGTVVFDPQRELLELRNRVVALEAAIRRLDPHYGQAVAQPAQPYWIGSPYQAPPAWPFNVPTAAVPLAPSPVRTYCLGAEQHLTDELADR